MLAATQRCTATGNDGERPPPLLSVLLCTIYVVPINSEMSEIMGNE